MVRLAAPILLIVAILVGSIALDDTPPRADFVFVNSSDVLTLDPQRMTYLRDLRMSYSLFEGLVRWDNRDFSIVPAAADLPTVSDDGRTYTFHVREDARWSNGAPVTAHDFAWSWRRLLLPDTAAGYSNLFFVIEGARTFWDLRSAHLAQIASLPSDQRESAATERWHQLDEAFDRLVGIRALDDRTLRVRLERPAPWFLELVAFGVACPVWRPCVEGWNLDDPGLAPAISSGWHLVAPPTPSACRWIRLDPASGRLEQTHGWARPGHLVGNGPFLLDQWRFKRDMRLVRSPTWHDARGVGCDSILALTISDMNTAVLAYEAGQVDWINDVSGAYEADLLEQRLRYEARHATELAALQNRGVSTDEAIASLPAPGTGERRDVHPRPAYGANFCVFNCRPPANGAVNPFANALIRRAFVLATDRATIVERVTRLQEPTLTSIVPPGSIRGYDPPGGLGHDPAGAVTELRRAGWMDRDGDGLVEDEHGVPFPVVDLLYTTSAARGKWVVLALRDQWERTLGVRVELRGVDARSHASDLLAGRFTIALADWYGDYGDPVTYLDLFRSTDGNNDAGYVDETTDAMLDAAAATRDPAQRLAILQACERRLFTETLPVLVLSQPVWISMYDPTRIRGLTDHPRQVQYLWQVEVTP